MTKPNRHLTCECCGHKETKDNRVFYRRWYNQMLWACEECGTHRNKYHIDYLREFGYAMHTTSPYELSYVQKQLYGNLRYG